MSSIAQATVASWRVLCDLQKYLHTKKIINNCVDHLYALSQIVEILHNIAGHQKASLCFCVQTSLSFKVIDYSY